MSLPIDWPRFHEQKSASAAARRRPGRPRTRRSLSLFVLDLLRERSNGIPSPSLRDPCARAHANVVGVSCQGAARPRFSPIAFPLLFFFFFLIKFCKTLDSLVSSHFRSSSPLSMFCLRIQFYGSLCSIRILHFVFC